MTPFQAFMRGFGRIRRHKRLLLWLYLLNVIFAAVLVVPFRGVVEEVAKTDLAEGFVAGFSLDAYIDVHNGYADTLKSVGMAALTLGGLYVLAIVFITGGVVASLASEERATLHKLIAASGEYFLRYLRLFVFLFIAIGSLVAVHQVVIADAVDNWYDGATTGRAAAIIRGADIVVLVFIASLILMVFDYAKIKLVLENRRSAFLAACSALRFAFEHPLRTTMLFYINVVVVGVAGAIYLVVENQFTNATMVSVLGLLAVQQVLVVVRTLMRLSFYASQMTFYQSHAIPQELAPAITLAPNVAPTPTAPPITPTPGPAAAPNG